MNTHSCPYCNAQVMIPDRVEAGQRVPCPRCGEVFVYRSSEAIATRPASGFVGAVGNMHEAVPTSVAPPGQRWSNRTIGAAVVGFMGLMAALGLVFVLYTQKDRRARDAVNPLGYLPADCNIIVALNLTEALKEPAGRKLAQLSFPLGPASFSVADIEKWTGLKREDIHQLVLGLKADALSFVLVAQTRDPYDPAAVRTALGANPAETGSQKTFYRFNLGNSPLQAALWCPAETVLAVAFSLERLNDVPDTPHPGVNHLAAPLRPLVLDRLDPSAQLWAVGHSDHWDEMLLPRLLLAKLPPGERKTLALAQTIGFWLRFEDETILVRSACNCASAEAAQTLRNYLVQQRVVPEQDLVVERDTWLMARARTDPAAVREMVRRTFLLGR
jgi:predicted RNA-binding Zn-ribbon protein involved in translation (DUF1610 family)